MISCLPGVCASFCSMHLLGKTFVRLTKILFFWFEWTNLGLAWETQSTPPMDPNKGMCPWSCLSLSTERVEDQLSLNSALTSPCNPWGQAMHFLQDLWVINFLFHFLLWPVVEPQLSIWHHVLHLTNVRWTKSYQKGDRKESQTQMPQAFSNSPILFCVLLLGNCFTLHFHASETEALKYMFIDRTGISFLISWFLLKYDWFTMLIPVVQ